MNGFPLPRGGTVAVAAPGDGPEHWAGAPSAALDDDGSLVVAYRVRVTDEDLAATVVARSTDGTDLTTVAMLDRSRFDAFSMERPALVRTETGRWRLYVCCASAQWPDSKHWWIEALEADTPEGLQTAEARVVFPGNARTAVKDPVVRRDAKGWHAWICCHPLDEPGEEDRMSTAYATSADGLTWDWQGTVLTGRKGAWDARGVRVTSVLPDGRGTYDGRASKEENFFERTGLSHARADEPVADIRYLDVLPLPTGGYRLFYEARRPDGSHELRTDVCEDRL